MTRGCLDISSAVTYNIPFSPQVAGGAMGFGPRHFVAPAAAFTMAVSLIFYVRYGISTARTESRIRTRQELQNLKEDRNSR